MRDIITVAKKEIRAFFSDKAILMQMFLLPFVIVFGYGMLMTATWSNTREEHASQDNISINAYSINAPAEFSSALKELGIKPAPDNDIEKYKSQIKSKDTDMLMVFPDDFKMGASDSDSLSNIDIFYNSDKNSSMELYSKATFVFTTMQPRIFTFNEAADVEYDLIDKAAMMRNLLGGIIPLMVFMAVYMVCMNLAANSIAGDKEKGFLNTLLITPIKRESLAAGKSLAILLVAVIASCSAFLGMALSLPKFSKALKISENTSYSIADYALLLGAVITGAFVFAVVLLIFSTIAKDVKQATTLSPILLLVIMIPSVLCSSESFSSSVEKLGTTNYLIPVWNSVKLLQDGIKVSYSWANAGITFGLNIAVALLGIVFIGKLFRREKIVNG
ncbi:MAG: ABC transporter permease [Ruminococcus sp.]|uniref:ABC transporter permease n=1 Tax=Ruminococcus sp. TaxID=41978 RepID=UPI0025E20795|nr:ABC transporter permease [Ruminococcus sp.]MBR5682106.1 ABC transporter permease [Ruminococcus sp.]